MTTQFDRIYHGLSPKAGKFRVAASGMAWREEEKDDVTAMSNNDVKWAQWLRVARGFQLRVGLKDRRREIFDGFEREDHDKLASLIKQHFGIVLEPVEVSFKGTDLAFLVSNKTSFELPLQHVANSNIAGRTEVSLEFANPSSSSKKPTKGAPDEMVEIRFFVPGTSTRPRGSDAGSQKSDNEDEEGEEISAAQAFHDAVKEKAELGQVSGDIILSFEEVLVLTPRGRYDVDMFPEFLRLRGKTYDYKIVYSTISRLFLLPKDDLHVLFILALNSPIRQGQTRYQYLVMQFSREEEITAKLNMSEEEIAKHERLKKHYEDPTFEVVSSVFRALSQKKIISAGGFQSRNGHPGIKANLKAIQGDLFMLEKYIFFVSKQPVLIELSDIHQAVFSRVGSAMGAAAARTFDLKIVTKSGPEYTFTSINKEEHEPTDAYLKDKKVRVKNEMMPDGEILLAGADDSDEEMQSVASDEDEEVHVKRTGDDDDESEDGKKSSNEDFEASSSDAGSPSSSGSDSDGGATASDASGDREFTKPKKAKGKAKDGGKKMVPKKNEGDANGDKTKKKPVPKPKKKGGSEDDGMSVDEERPKPKPKPKKPAPKPKVREGEEVEPAKKKQKTSAD
ncbi:hypothetical protein EW146_g4688 [Bondarzewia mesenterica]|uniref:FACT complex subunit POB3 n=1 Tax=Bondarzewia mesenterica TaxID=1095465 RepID=A0A4V3XF24_9AGAM|nr:hypothetical protein EW146_g4688 [Bondarzewia mesenterica]